MPRLILQLRETTSSDHLVADWWFFDAQQLTSQGSSASPEQMLATWQHLRQQGVSTKQASNSVEVVMFVPAHRVHMRQLSLSKAQRRHLNRVLPYLLEPYLAQNVDEMHFISAAAPEEKVWTFAVAHSHMQSWQIWTAVFAGYQVSLLALPSLLSSVSTDLAVELLGECFQFQQEQWCWLPKSLAPKQATSVQDSIGVNQNLSQSSAWRRFNLLQAGYQVRSSGSKTRHRPWGWAVILSLFSFSAYCLNTYLNTQSLNQQAQNLEAKANQAFLQLLPEEGRVVNLSRQMAARLQQVDKPSNQQGISAYEVLAMLDSVRKVSSKQQGLQSIAWQPQGYRFEWRASSRSELESIQQALSNQGVELEQTVRHEQGYLGVFRAQRAPL